MGQWYYARDKEKVGPFSFAELRELAVAGQLQTSAMVFQAGTTKWVPANSVPWLFLPNLSLETRERARRVTDNVSGGDIRCIDELHGQVTAIAFSPTGRFALAASSKKFSHGLVRIWEVPSGKLTKTILCDYAICAAAFSPNTPQIILGGMQSTLTWIDIETKTEIKRTHPEQGTVHDVSYSSDGTRLLTCFQGTSLSLWDSNSGEFLRCIANEKHTASCAVFSQDNRAAVCAGFDGKVRLWNLDTSQLMRVVNVSDVGASGYALSFDGQHVLTSGAFEYGVRGVKNCGLQLWSIQTGKEVKRLSGHTEHAAFMALSWKADHAISVCCSEERTVRIWDVQLGQEICKASFNIAMGPGGYGSPLAISPDGKMAIFGDLAGDVFLWLLPT